MHRHGRSERRSLAAIQVTVAAVSTELIVEFGAAQALD
jgi:hypothetical protein